MKKQRKKTSKSGHRNIGPAPAGNSDDPISRRGALRFLRNAAIATPAIGIAGYFSVKSVQATVCEADLSKIGKGLPAIVQIHDPQCAQCRTLQRQSRRALRSFDNKDFQFLVANINTIEGGTLAGTYGVPHVTLLMFDPRGRMVQIVRGPTETENLHQIFTAHIERYS